MHADTTAAPLAATITHALRSRAWFTAWMAMITTMCCSTSVVLVNVGIFMNPLQSAFGWSRYNISISLSVGAIVMALANPLVGRLMDRYGVRPVLIASFATYGLALAATPMLIGLGLSGLYIAYALIAGLGAGSNVIAYVRILSGWFSGPLNDSRGLALGLSSAGVPLGMAVTGPLAVLAIDRFGWQGGYWTLALLPLLIGLPLAASTLRSAPYERDAKAARENQALPPGLDVAQAMRGRPFWILMGIVLLMSSCLQGIAIHVTPLLRGFNMSPENLATFLFINGVIGIVARVGAGYLFDRAFAPHVSVAIFGVAALSSFALAGFPGLVVAIIAALLIVISSGAESDLIGLLVGRYFGLRAYGQIFGLIYGVFMVGIAIGPYLFGLAYDTWQNYTIPFIFAGAGLTMICVLLMLLPPFPRNHEAAAEQPAAAPNHPDPAGSLAERG